MLRVRRYRIFLVVTVFAVLALYQFSRIRRPTSTPKIDIESLKHVLPGKLKEPNAEDLSQKPLWGPERPRIEQEERSASSSSEIEKVMEPTPAPSLAALSSFAAGEEDTKSPAVPVATPSTLLPAADPDQGSGQGEGRVDAPLLGSDVVKIHWTKFPEHFPVPSESIISLPTAKPKSIPKIQAEPKGENWSAKADREAKLGAIKEAFTHAWGGYKKYAWLQDELSPVSGAFRNPFCGWGATLVDTLDTLWIMGLKSEFDQAAKAVNQIDFTTATREDIPLFETNIRYLGGLLAAYDISGGKYRNLLDKAVEIAEILMCAFDTPNRMPVTFYKWKPQYASQPQHAGTRVVLSEIGSLSVEFTRLAQITKEPRYYDAIARITNALEVWQNNTRLPGMWPKAIDASGCHLVYPSSNQDQSGGAGQGQFVETPAAESQQKPVLDVNEGIKGQATVAGHDLGWDSGHLKDKRELQESVPMKVVTPSPLEPICEPQGLASPPHTRSESFTLGSNADSLYEYLPKEWMLLGGVNDQYRTMYEQTIEVAKKHLLYRPMNPEDLDILISGSVTVADRGGLQLTAEGTHLTCFVGGMFAIGAKIFNRPDELDLAEKLTKGCIWAYHSTATGIMPEEFTALPCEDPTSCAWNETKWWDALDPFRKHRELDVLQARVPTPNKPAEKATENKDVSADLIEVPHAPQNLMRRQLDKFEAETFEMASPAEEPTDPRVNSSPHERQSRIGESTYELDKYDDEEPDTIPAVNESPSKTTLDTNLPERASLPSPDARSAPPKPPYIPKPLLNHEEYVKKRIENERIPPGFVTIPTRKYILRPEAIESVFILYRITGNDYYRRKGWDMFQAVESWTRTELGNTAIGDVTSTAPEPWDEMESFWLAETLKYFYLLFSDEEVVSLDDWVFNTEAHPLKRPKA